MAACLAPLAIAQHLLRIDLSCDDTLALPVLWQAPLFSDYLQGLFVTFLVEAPFFLLTVRMFNVGWRRGLVALVICNLATHPVIHFVLLPVAASQQWSVLKFVLAAELFAALGESLIVQRVYQRRSLALGALVVLANLISWSFS